MYGGGRSSGSSAKTLTPILDQILNGGSSITFNLIRKRKELGDDARFFARESLNKVIIFKYPNFDIELADMRGFDFGAGSKLAELDKPIETAIFVPNDDRRMEIGGAAIYLRQKQFQELLGHYFGLDIEGEDLDGDIKKLTILDQAPSLDPFLLKTSLEREKVDIDGRFFDLPPGEEREIKRHLTARIQPIIQFALEGHTKKKSGGGNDTTQRFIDAIWDPSLPEARLFIKAFRIDEKEVDSVFDGWKGVSYYQYLFAKNAHGLKTVVGWFRSPYARPVDASQYRIYMEGLEMHKRQVFHQLEHLLRSVRQVFNDYDAAYQAFFEQHDPRPLRDFFRTAATRYWVLGFTCSALLHCVNIFDRALRGDPKGRINFDQMSDMLSRMQATLSSQMSNDLPPPVSGVPT
ncbi:MAG: hypothetical protein NXI16_10500 [Alphaproteobacteria bacterium]|nr:hypothetical protein [Alphaproteobacteria bacterium]